jgi:hypothetical protein
MNIGSKWWVLDSVRHIFTQLRQQDKLPFSNIDIQTIKNSRLEEQVCYSVVKSLNFLFS